MFARCVRFFPIPKSFQVDTLRFLIKSLLVLAVLGLVGYFSWPPIARAIAERNKPRWRTAEVKTGVITKVVNATGTVRPVKSVQVGSFVSGPIQDLYVEFNEEVKEGQLLATIDSRLFASIVTRDEAILESRKAEVQRVQATLQQAMNDEKRASILNQQKSGLIPQAEMDQYTFNRKSLEAQLAIARAAVAQAQASLVNSRANLDYCEIRSPVDGMIIDRKVEPGQTLAAQFQTPELFVIGVGMRDKMHIFADVDESEIGLIRQAAQEGRPVTFTIDAYPDDLFEGKIEEVRFSANTTQNVVTYPVVVAAANPDLKLLPGMTANLSFEVQQTGTVIQIPKAALRFYPPDIKYVHPDDRGILAGDDWGSTDATPEAAPATARVAMRKRDQRRHVWIYDGEFLRAIEVHIGISSNRYGELISGELAPGTALVTGQKAAGEK